MGGWWLEFTLCPLPIPHPSNLHTHTHTHTHVTGHFAHHQPTHASRLILQGKKRKKFPGPGYRDSTPPFRLSEMCLFGGVACGRCIHTYLRSYLTLLTPFLKVVCIYANKVVSKCSKSHFSHGKNPGGGGVRPTILRWA